MKLFSATLPEFPEDHHSNLKTGKMLITPKDIRKMFENSLTATGFADRLMRAVKESELEILLHEVDVD